MTSVRVLIVDDSADNRRALRSLLESQTEVQIWQECGHGEAALRLLKNAEADNRPQLMILALDRAGLDGLSIIRRVMAEYPLPILALTRDNRDAGSEEAIRAGALDSMTFCGTTSRHELVAKVQLLAGVRVVTHLQGKRPDAIHKDPVPKEPAQADPAHWGNMPSLPFPTDPTDDRLRIFAIAASTGGPQALAVILSLLPADFPAAILIAQHIGTGFAQNMTDWLDRLSPLRVQVARLGDKPQPGLVLFSPAEADLSLTSSGLVVLHPARLEAIYHPSCDILLRSVAEVCGPRAVGMILTGMGQDGVAGLAAIRKHGGTTLAQDEESSVVFGMNRLAIDQGLADKTLNPAALAAEMVRLAAQPLPNPSSPFSKLAVSPHGGWS